MKITNIVIAAMMVVAAPSFAQVAVAPAVEAGIVASVKSLTPTETQVIQKLIGSNQTGEALGRALVATLKSAQGKQIEKVINRSGSTASVNVQEARALLAVKATQNPDQVNSKPADGAVTVESTDRRRQGGSQIDSTNQEETRGQEDIGTLLNRCEAGGSVAPISGACDKLDANSPEALAWNRASADIIGNARRSGITKVSQIMDNKATWTKGIVAGMRSAFPSDACQKTIERIRGLAASACKLLGLNSIDEATLVGACAR